MANSSSNFGFFDDEPQEVDKPVENAETLSTPAESSPQEADSTEDPASNAAPHTPVPGDVLEMNQRYLVFNLSGTKYATPLLAAREVIEVPPFREIPNAKSYFLGLANLRGEVVGIIDLRKMFNLDSEAHERNSIIIYESSSGPLGAMIDEISGVVNLGGDSIAQEVNIKSNVPQKYLKGIAKLNDGELVIVLDLKNVLEEDDLVQIKKLKKSA